ncbi:MAG: cyclic nucleotide-binding domain-containing protein [Chloroflexota bacterium]
MFLTTANQQVTTQNDVIRSAAPFRWPQRADINQQVKTGACFVAGETITPPTTARPHIYVILEGDVLISQRGQKMVTLSAGELVGGFDDWGLTAVAKTDCRLAAISQKQARMLAAHPPEFVLRIAKTMVDTLTRQPS